MREDWAIGEMNNSDAAFEFLNTYIKPYIKSFEIEKRKLLGMNMATIRFVDGSQMSIKIGSCYDIYYDINGEKNLMSLVEIFLLLFYVKKRNM